MNALCQMMHVVVQAKKKTHHVMQHVLIMMEATIVNVQMVINYTKMIYA